VKYFNWNLDKNELLKTYRNIAFEDIIFSISHDGLLDVIDHPNKKKHPGQKIFIVNIENYAYLVPFVERDDSVFLKTIIPSRKMTKKYLEE